MLCGGFLIELFESIKEYWIHMLDGIVDLLGEEVELAIQLRSSGKCPTCLETFWRGNYITSVLYMGVREKKSKMSSS